MGFSLYTTLEEDIYIYTNKSEIVMWYSLIFTETNINIWADI